MICSSVLHIAPVPPGMIDHPSSFLRLIKLYSYKHDTVLSLFGTKGTCLGEELCRL